MSDRSKDRATDPAAEAERRRRLAAAFGDALPETTGDEHAEGWGETNEPRERRDDEWLRRQVPPHHG